VFDSLREVLQELFLESPKSVPITLWLRKSVDFIPSPFKTALFYFILFSMFCFICYLKTLYSCKVCREFNERMYIISFFNYYKLD
jgi:hypothetical protein